jgi:hypothetical protein
MAKIDSRAVFITALNKTLEQALVDGDISSASSSEKYKDQSFDVAIPTSVFVVTVYNFVSSNKLDVWVNGLKKRATLDYTRDDAGNSITFTESIPANAWVEVRIWI